MSTHFHKSLTKKIISESIATQVDRFLGLISSILGAIMSGSHSSTSWKLSSKP